MDEYFHVVSRIKEWYSWVAMSISLFFCDWINLSSKRPDGRNTIHMMDRLGHLQVWMEAPSSIQGSSLSPGIFVCTGLWCLSGGSSSSHWDLDLLGLVPMVSWAHPLWFTCGFVPATPKGFHIPSHRLSPLCTLLVSHHRLLWDTGNLRTCSPSSRRWRQTLLAWMHLPLLLSRAADACWCDIPPVTRSLLPYGLSSFPAPPAQVTGAASVHPSCFSSPPS